MKRPDSFLYRIAPQVPEHALIHRAARVIAAGGVVGFPTHSLYGLGADALNPVAIDKVFAIKGRSRKRPVLVLITECSDLGPLIQNLSAAAVKLMQRFWPGRVTLVFEARRGLPPGLTAGSGKIGVRMAAHPVARALLHQLHVPLTATSANLSGHLGVSHVKDLDRKIAAKLDLILDAGPLAGGPGSTVVDVSVHPPRILRQGSVPARRIFESV